MKHVNQFHLLQLSKKPRPTHVIFPRTTLLAAHILSSIQDGEERWWKTRRKYLGQWAQQTNRSPAHSPFFSFFLCLFFSSPLNSIPIESVVSNEMVGLLGSFFSLEDGRSQWLVCVMFGVDTLSKECEELTYIVIWETNEWDWIKKSLLWVRIYVQVNLIN